MTKIACSILTLLVVALFSLPSYGQVTQSEEQIIRFQKGIANHLECSVFYTISAGAAAGQGDKEMATRHLKYAKLLEDRALQIGDTVDFNLGDIKQEKSRLLEKYKKELKGNFTNMTVLVKRFAGRCMTIMKHPGNAF